MKQGIVHKRLRKIPFPVHAAKGNLEIDAAPKLR